MRVSRGRPGQGSFCMHGPTTRTPGGIGLLAVIRDSRCGLFAPGKKTGGREMNTKDVFTIGLLITSLAMAH